jgi:hypothetical protein
LNEVLDYLRVGLESMSDLRPVLATLFVEMPSVDYVVDSLLAFAPEVTNLRE